MQPHTNETNLRTPFTPSDQETDWAYSTQCPGPTRAQWQGRLRAHVLAKGGHFEYSL